MAEGVSNFEHLGSHNVFPNWEKIEMFQLWWVFLILRNLLGSEIIFLLTKNKQGKLYVLRDVKEVLVIWNVLNHLKKKFWNNSLKKHRSSQEKWTCIQYFEHVNFLNIQLTYKI